MLQTIHRPTLTDNKLKVIQAINKRDLTELKALDWLANTVLNRAELNLFNKVYLEAERQQTTTDKIQELLDAYGFKLISTAKQYGIYNTKGNLIIVIPVSKSKKYVCYDSVGTKLLSGNNEITTGIERVLSQYYFAKKLI